MYRTASRMSPILRRDLAMSALLLHMTKASYQRYLQSDVQFRANNTRRKILLLNSEI